MIKKIVLILLIIVIGGFAFLFIKGNKTDKELNISIDFNNEDGNLKYLWQGHYDIDGAVYNIGTNKDSQELLKGIVKYWRVSTGRWEVQTPKSLINENEREFFTGRTLEDAQNPKFYNWTYLDQVLDEVEALGAKPLINFDSMPKSLAKNTKEIYNDNTALGLQIPYEFNNNIRNSPPNDPEVYAEVIKRVIMHYNKGWANGHYRDYKYIEIGNEPELPIFWIGTEEEYFKTYEKTAQRIKDYFGDEIKIGGGAFAGIDLTGKFIVSNLKNNIPMDFVSFHQYASPKNNPNDFKYIKGVATNIKKMAKEKNRNIEIFLDEWGPNLDTWVTKNPYNANLDMIDYVLFEGSVYSILEDTDLTMTFKTLIIDRPNKLNRGHISYHPSKPKPVYYLYEALKQFNETPIKLKTININDKIYGIVAKGEKEINILLINNDNKQATINLSLHNLSANFSNDEYQKYELTQESFNQRKGLQLIDQSNLTTNNTIKEVINPKSVNLLKIIGE